MSIISSDSEVEVFGSPPKITPRAVRRPQASRGSAELSSSDSEDDVSFFTYRRATVAPVEVPEPVVNIVPTEVVAEETGELPEFDSESERSAESSDSEVEEVDKQRGNSEDLEGESEGQSKRARSVSVTPPPDTSVQPAAPKRPRNERTRATPAEPIYIASPPDTSDLDPSLLAAIISGGSAPDSSVKVQIEFRLAYDDHFLSSEVPLTWDARRWGRVKPHESQKVRKKLDEGIAVVVFAGDTVGRALQTFSDNFRVDVAAMDPVLMQGEARVFLTSRVASLGSAPVHYVRVYPRSVYMRLRAREEEESRRREAERQEMCREMEIARELRRNASVEEVEDVEDAEQQQEQEEGPPEGAIRIKIRNKDGKDQLLMVMPTTTVQSVVDSYRAMAGLPADASVRLEFDDEKLDPSLTIADTEIEDDDMLTAF